MSSERGELEAPRLRLGPQSLRRLSGRCCAGREAEGGGRGAEVAGVGCVCGGRSSESGPGFAGSPRAAFRAPARAGARRRRRQRRRSPSGDVEAAALAAAEATAAARAGARAQREEQPNLAPEAGPASQPRPARVQPCAPPAESGRLTLRPPPAAARSAWG